VGIENVGRDGASLTVAQLEADAALVRDLAGRLPSIRYLIGHHEYTDRRLPHYALFKELDPNYRPTVKSDPGPEFMSRLRERVKQRGLTLED
jgi:hypothetical protein